MTNALVAATMTGPLSSMIFKGLGFSKKLVGLKPSGWIAQGASFVGAIVFSYMLTDYFSPHLHKIIERAANGDLEARKKYGDELFYIVEKMLESRLSAVVRDRLYNEIQAALNQNPNYFNELLWLAGYLETPTK